MSNFGSITTGAGYQAAEDRGWFDIAKDYGRAAAQGVTFGFADELEAKVRSALDSDASYEDVVQLVRADINDFRQRNPGAAFGTEIAASILPMIAAQFVPGAGQAATVARATQIGRAAARVVPQALKGRVGRGAASAGAQGGVYGFGAGEEGLANRLRSAGVTAALSGGIGAGITKTAPYVTEQAKQLIRRGVPVTPGQAVRGSTMVGNAIAGAEEKLAGTLPFIGDAIKGAMERSLKGFNRATFDEAFAPIRFKAPKGKEGRELMGIGDDTISKAYDDVLSKMSLTNDRPLYEAVVRVSESANKDIRNRILDTADNLIFDRIDDAGVLAGDALKSVQSELRKEIQNLRIEPNAASRRMADALEDISRIFNKELSDQNAPGLAKRLNDVDRAYGNFEIVRNASMRRAAKQGEATTGDLLQEVKKADPTRRKSQFSRGGARLQDTAQAGQDVIGSRVGDSGTAARDQATRLASLLAAVGAGAVDPTIGGTLAASAMAAYTPAGVPIARGLLSSIGGASRRVVPGVSSQIQQAGAPDNVRAMLARALAR
tara:strand:- start:391 stop:2031 length:1641 start_codon:yes stop_codon:yes gene_type:complete